MAYRSSAIASSSSGGNLTATPPGVAAHDYLCGIYMQDIAGLTPTQPTGWNSLIDMDLSGPDGQSVQFSDKNDASGSDSFQWSTGFGFHNAVINSAFSGRDNAAPRSTAPVVTRNTSGNSFPVSASLTGITATAGDDIAVLVGVDQAGDTGRCTLSTISGYTERQDGVNTDWVSGMGLQTADNVSAGATGSLAFTITLASGSASSAGYAGIVVAIKAAAGGGPTLRRKGSLALLGVGR